MKRRLSKVLRFTGKAAAPWGLVFNQSLLVDCPAALYVHTVKYPRPRACIHKEGRRMCRVGKPVDSLLPLTLQTNIMTLQLKQTDQEPEPLFAGIGVGAKELILVIDKNGTTLLNCVPRSEFVLELQVKSTSREWQIGRHSNRLKGWLPGITIKQV